MREMSLSRLGQVCQATVQTQEPACGYPA